MFRIKKDEYNTVQLLPDFKSAERSGGRQVIAPAPISMEVRDSRRRRKTGIFLAVILVLAVLALIAGRVLWQHRPVELTPEEYLESLQDKDYDRCALAASGLKEEDKEDFQKAVRAEVLDQADQVYEAYRSGDLEAGDALKEMEEINRASDEWFSPEMEAYMGNVSAIDGIYQNLYKVPDLMDSGKFGEAYGILKDSVDQGVEYGANPSWLVKPMVYDNLAGLKAYLFNEFAAQVVKGTDGYRYIEDSGEFILNYTEDRDVRNYLSTLTLVKDGKQSASYAAEIARTVADKSLGEWNQNRT